MRNRKEERRLAGLVAMALVGLALALTLTACGGGDSTTSASSTPATTPPAKSTSTTAHKKSSKSSKTAHRVSRRAHFVLTAQAKRGRAAGKRACAKISRQDALAHFLASAKAAEKHHHVAARAGMIARINQLPKSAYKGTAAPAMAAALVATGMPVKQRAGGFAGCMGEFRRNG